VRVFPFSRAPPTVLSPDLSFHTAIKHIHTHLRDLCMGIVLAALMVLCVCVRGCRPPKGSHIHVNMQEFLQLRRQTRPPARTLQMRSSLTFNTHAGLRLTGVLEGGLAATVARA